jgi:AraC-like DNA-binding protein
MADPTLTYYDPPESLKPYVSFFYEFNSYTNHFHDYDRADYAQMRFILGGTNGWFDFIDGVSQPMPPVFVVGPTMGRTGVRGDGHIFLFGVGLRPAGWAAIMPIDASKAVNRVFDAAELFGSHIQKTHKTLLSLTNTADRLKVGYALLEALIGFENEQVRSFTALVDEWLSSSLSPDVNSLVEASGLSRRQVERNCKRYYGAPPKMLARKYRATRAAVRLANGETCEDDLIENGFYDQSHFIRELKHFTGMTPKMIKENLSDLPKLTFRRSEIYDVQSLETAT